MNTMNCPAVHVHVMNTINCPAMHDNELVEQMFMHA